MLKGFVLAGSGKDLQAARAPRYFRCKQGLVALVAMASDFIPYGKASFSRPDLPGRPGLNPLTVTGGKPAILVPKAMKKSLWLLTKFGLRFRDSDHYGLVTGFRVNPEDLRANLDAITTAAAKANIVVTSVHAHRQGPWLTKVAHQAIEHGANIIFIHGPHKVQAIETYRERPIFYSLGDFVFETHCITRFPAELYQARGSRPEAAFQELAAWDAPKLYTKPKTYEGLAASITFTGGRITRIRLVPVDLQSDAAGARFWPRLISVVKSSTGLSGSRSRLGSRFLGTARPVAVRLRCQDRVEASTNFLAKSTHETAHERPSPLATGGLRCS